MSNSVDVKFKIDLSKLQLEQSMFCKYDPEVFPGLTYRMHTPEVVLLVFHRSVWLRSAVVVASLP
jgi:transcription initiation factor TFIID TATA-box-binding protein